MTPRTGSEIALGLIGVYFVAASIPQLVVSIGLGLRDQNPDPMVLVVGVIGPILTAAVGGALVILRRPLSLKLAPGAEEQGPEAGTTWTHATAISVVGVYFMAIGLSGLLREILLALPRSQYGSSLTINTWAEPLAETVTGVALFFGSRGIVSLWRSARGIDRRSQSADSP